MAPKIVKRRGKQLDIRVRKIGRRPVNNREPSNRLRISFFSHIRKEYVDSSSTSLGGEQEITAHKTLWVDNSVFFKSSQQLDAYIIISQVLTSLKVLAYLHDNIIAKILSMGQSTYKNGIKVRRNNFNRMYVHLTWINTFVGDPDSVKELLDAIEEEPQRRIVF